MKRLFPIMKQVNIPSLVTSFSVAVALCCQVIAMRSESKVALTLFVFVLLLTRIEAVIAGHFGQMTAFGKEMGSLAAFLKFIITPIVILYSMGVKSVVSFVFFALFLLAGIWRLADINQSGMVQKDSKTFFRGLSCTHAGAIFAMIACVWIRFFQSNLSFVFIPFLAIAALLMISAFLYDSKGKLTFSFYFLALVSVILMWL